MGAATRQISRLAVLALLAASQLAASGQPQIAHVDFAAPEATPETVADTSDFPFLSKIDGTALIKTARIDEPLEVKAASAETDAMLAGASFVQKSYTAPLNIWDLAFVALYRNALIQRGWRILDEPPPAVVENEPHVISLSAHYAANGRDLYTRVSRTPDGSYQISVADVGAEDWGEMLNRECHIPIYSVHFKRDLSLSYEDSQPSLEKLAGMLRSQPNLRVEVQGHTDNSGDEKELLAQSARRARFVHFALEKLGVPSAHMAVRGYGKSRPVAPNDTDWGRMKNRRIEIARQNCEATGELKVQKLKVDSSSSTVPVAVSSSRSGSRSSSCCIDRSACGPAANGTEPLKLKLRTRTVNFQLLNFELSCCRPGSVGCAGRSAGPFDHARAAELRDQLHTRANFVG